MTADESGATEEEHQSAEKMGGSTTGTDRSAASMLRSDTTRRGVLAAVIAGGVGGLSLSGAQDLLEAFAPLSGDAWDAMNREISETVSSPHGPATVYRDEEGVPHIEAESEAAASYAAGYVQAFDRMAQMDLIRRRMRGQVAEVAGEGLADDDEFNRKMDFVGAAEAAVEMYEGTHLETLGNAFAQGVNDAMETEPLQMEFGVLGYEPREWTLVDSLLMEKQISWGLTGNLTELRFTQVVENLEDVLGEADAQAVLEGLYPTRLDHDSPILREGTEGTGGVAPDLRPSGDPHGEVGPELTEWLTQFEPPPNVGSNNWVVSGEHTESGQPVVANDTHLPLMAPPVWYELHIDLPDYSVRGLTFPGVPFIVIGANQNGAWGFTNSGADVVDCYTYEFDESGDRYRYGEEWLEVEREEQEIVIDGAENRTIDVEKTVHGPLIEQHGQRVGLAWTGFAATRTVESMYEINRSTGYEDVREAIELFDLPTQCFVYGDDDGRTMFWLTGQIPERDEEPLPATTIYDGSAPEGEWEGYTPYAESSWDGFIPFEEKPHAVDPDLVATANQRIADETEHYIGIAYAAPYRGGRIYDLFDESIDAGETLSLEDQMAIQYDYRDGRGPDVVPELLEAVESADVSESVAVAAATLEAWDYEMDAESEAALIFSRWYDQFRDHVMNPAFEEAELGSGMFLRDWVFAKLPADNPLFDDRSRAATMVDALEAAVEEIDEAGWSVYGDWNSTGAIAHPFGAQLPFMNYPDWPTHGSRMTVNNFGKGRFGTSASGSAFRMLAEPGGEKRMIVPGGNSGDYFSEHYHDQLQRYIDGEYRSMALEVSGELLTEFEGDGE